MSIHRKIDWLIFLLNIAAGVAFISVIGTVISRSL